jgi:hypothetical protein
MSPGKSTMWNDADATANYFTELMIPSRPNRGFPPAVAAELMSLSMAYDRIGHLLVAEEAPAQSPVAAYRWDQSAWSGKSRAWASH